MTRNETVLQTPTRYRRDRYEHDAGVLSAGSHGQPYVLEGADNATVGGNDVGVRMRDV